MPVPGSPVSRIGVWWRATRLAMSRMSRIARLSHTTRSCTLAAPTLERRVSTSRRSRSSSSAFLIAQATSSVRKGFWTQSWAPSRIAAIAPSSLPGGLIMMNSAAPPAAR